ncbi:hypothetical protein [Pseudomarimonas arenosa]|uniref:Uncharacterized protein n=1 Tax=Pseudomarimonas arenosa TaxID=2774145 RepID=A0AAW3ZS91_9GAMM|nr:hypothetical protein [Pseudomarimonas arenosa]MBD8527377.1 hypothetical protein [Pseudomarimonas arenosa]
MGRARTLALCGLDSGEEQAVRDFFAGAVKRCGIPWALVSEADADALLIDVDSMYGQMTWLRARGGPRPIVALTSAVRADADFMLPRPATEDGLAHVLGMLTERVAAPTAAAEPIAPATPAAAPAKPAKAAKSEPPKPAPAPAPAQAAAPEPEPLPERDLQLVDYLRNQLLPGPVRLRGAEPALLIDPIAKLYVGGTPLKPYLPLAQRKVIDADHWDAITSGEFQRQANDIGSQPLARLLWIAGLGCGQGELHYDLQAASRFKLSKYPTTEREFPKHIRLATAMLKQLSTVEELVAGSGLDRTDVCDFINACHAIGLVETDQPAAVLAAAEQSKGGLLSRLRGKR